jgi:hypothetical protein
MYLQFPTSVSCKNIQEVLDHVTTMCPISKHSVLFEFPKESDHQVLEPLLCGYIQNILSHVITMYQVGIFLHIHDILSLCNHILHEWLKESMLTM